MFIQTCLESKVGERGCPVVQNLSFGKVWCRVYINIVRKHFSRHRLNICTIKLAGNDEGLVHRGNYLLARSLKCQQSREAHALTAPTVCLIMIYDHLVLEAKTNAILWAVFFQVGRLIHRIKSRQCPQQFFKVYKR